MFDSSSNFQPVQSREAIANLRTAKMQSEGLVEMTSALVRQSDAYSAVLRFCCAYQVGDDRLKGKQEDRLLFGAAGFIFP